LIASDTPRQIDWHLQGAVRNGASIAEIQAVRQIAIEVARAAGITWKNDIPDIQIQV
jgi:alkylhydroperoxidase/carboxymuconolactone decarboxylase family protein YurZ